MAAKKDSEKLIERKLRERVQRAGGFALKLLDFGGIPDRLLVLPDGRTLFVELKSTGAKPTKLQLYRHRQLRELGHRAEVIDNLNDLNTLLDELGI